MKTKTRKKISPRIHQPAPVVGRLMLRFALPDNVLAICYGTFDRGEEYVSVEFALCRPELNLGEVNDRVHGEGVFRSWGGDLIKMRHLFPGQGGILVKKGKVKFAEKGLEVSIHTPRNIP